MKYRLYKRNIKSYLTQSSSIYFVAVIFLILSTFKPMLGDSMYKYLMQFVGFFFVCFIFYFNFKSLFQKEKIKSNFVGYLELLDDKIIISNREYRLNEIETLEFFINDFDNKMKDRNNEFDIDPAVSNGTGNTIRIELKKNVIIKLNFQILNKDDFKQHENSLIIYFTSGILKFSNLLHSLKVHDKTEIKRLEAITTKNILNA